MDESGGELNALLVAVREALDLVVGTLGDARGARARSPWRVGASRRHARAAARGTRAARRRACSGRGPAPRACSRSGAARPGRRGRRSSAPSRLRGRSGRRSPASSWSSPAPLGPRKPTTCPAGTEKVSPSSAVSEPNRRVRPSSSRSPAIAAGYACARRGRHLQLSALLARVVDVDDDRLALGVPPSSSAIASGSSTSRWITRRSGLAP